MVSTGFADPTYSLIIQKEEKDNVKTKAHVYGYVLQC